MFIKLSLSEDAQGPRAPGKIQLLRTGNFDGGFSDYKFDITEEILIKLKENFDKKVRGYDDGKLPLDYFHESYSKAAGWIVNLFLTNNNTELWAEVEWTPTAEKMILDKELKYVSVEFSFEYIDNETNENFGPTLFGAGLTNRPFVKGMEPLNLSERKKLGGLMTELEQAKKQIEELTSQVAEMKTQKETVETELSSVKEALQNKEAEIKASEKKAAFDKMLSEGKVVEAQREAYLASDFVKFSELAMPLNTKQKGSEQASETENRKASDRVLELARKIKTEKNLPIHKAISSVLLENKELATEYLNEVKLQ